MQSSKHSKSHFDKTSVLLALHGLALLFILIVFVIDVYIGKNPPTRVLMRMLIVVLTISYSFFRILRHQASRLEAVEKLYANKIEDAFKSDRSGKKLLLSALTDYSNHQLSDCIDKLNRLKEKAATPQEQRMIRYFLALSFNGMGNTDEAIKLYNEILEKTPSYAPALSNLSVIYTEQKNYSLAINYAQKALKNDPANPFAYNNLAGAYFYINDFEKARKYASTALELKKDLPSAATLLAIIDAICGSKMQAGQSFDLAVALGEKTDVLNEAIKTYKEQYHRHAVLEACLFDWKNKTSIPSIHFTLDGNTKKSIIGGQINEPAPLDSKGQKMRLLAAIFCSELPLNHIFPKCGVLRFFNFGHL